MEGEGCYRSTHRSLCMWGKHSTAWVCLQTQSYRLSWKTCIYTLVCKIFRSKDHSFLGLTQHTGLSSVHISKTGKLNPTTIPWASLGTSSGDAEAWRKWDCWLPSLEFTKWSLPSDDWGWLGARSLVLVRCLTRASDRKQHPLYGGTWTILSLVLCQSFYSIQFSLIYKMRWVWPQSSFSSRTPTRLTI